MNEYIYVILIHDCDVVIPIGYERNEETAKRKVCRFLGLLEKEVSTISVEKNISSFTVKDIGKEISEDGVIICKVPYHGIDEYLYEGKYV